MSMINTPHRSRGLTIAQLILSLLGITQSIIALAVIGIAISIPGVSTIGADQLGQLKAILWVVGLTVLIAIPSLILSIRRLRGKTPSRGLRHGLLISSLALLLVPLILLMEEIISSSDFLSRLSPLLNILMVILPLWWFVELGRHRLNAGSAQRQWGIANFSIFLTLPIVIIAELLVLLLGFLFASAWLVQQPEFSSLLQQLQNQLMLNPLDIQNFASSLEPLLSRPEVLAAGLLGVSLILPMVEEFLKPLAVWLFVKHGLTPAGGFTAGLICGASFALLESSLTLVSVSSDTWVFTVIGRVGAGLLHTVLTGLNGWALASAWQDKKFLRLGVTYLITVLVHGTWNLFAVFAGLKMAGEQTLVNISPLLKNAAIWVLGGLAILMLATLIIVNRKLRSPAVPPALFAEPPPVIG